MTLLIANQSFQSNCCVAYWRVNDIDFGVRQKKGNTPWFAPDELGQTLLHAAKWEIKLIYGKNSEYCTPTQISSGQTAVLVSNCPERNVPSTNVHNWVGKQLSLKKKERQMG